MADEPTIIFLFDFKNWYEKIHPLSKLDLIDIAPLVSSQFYIDHTIQAYVFALTHSKWITLDQNLKKKFMFISRTLKEMIEGPLTSIQRETYENSDIFELLMAQQTNTKTLTEEPEEEIVVPDLA